MLDVAAMAPGRFTPSGNLFLTLGGVKCGPVRSAEGGIVSAEVVISKPASGAFASKHLSTVRYEPFVVDVGFSNAAPLYDWVSDLWKGKFDRKSGSLVLTDYKFEAKHERKFSNALLTETSFPALDAASKEQGFLTLKFSPELIQSTSASGKQDGAGAKAKQWLRSGFRLQIDGLDCTKVAKIESLSVKGKTSLQDTGESKLPELEPTVLEFPNLEITLSEVSSKTWFDWLEDFVIKGKNDESSERSGTIQLLAPDAKTELARIKLFGLGIYRIDTAKSDGRGDKASRVTAELYCRRMELVVKP
jgi:hypothetical protein